MKIPIVLAAWTASASVIVPRAGNSTAPSLPGTAFQKFQVITLDQAKQGLDREIQGLPPKPLSNLTEDKYFASAAKIGVNLFESTSNKAAASCASAPNYRVEWRQYATSQRSQLVNAMRCLIARPPSGTFPNAKNRWEDFVQLHQSLMPQVHNNALFLIWHRYFLWTFEQVLRRECGFGVNFVWWDETLDAGNFENSDMFTNPNYFGNLPGLNNGNPVCISTSAFASVTAHIGPGTGFTNHCISRGVTESNTAQCNANFVNYCLSRTAYADFESCFEYG
jgi:tyrosinase